MIVTGMAQDFIDKLTSTLLVARNGIENRNIED